MHRPPGSRMSGGIDAAMNEARLLRAQVETAKSRRSGIQKLIAWTDAMLDELELENLRGVREVSPVWWSRLAALGSSLPFDVGLACHLPRTPVEVLDLVYAVQERLFAIKNGPPAGNSQVKGDPELEASAPPWWVWQ